MVFNTILEQKKQKNFQGHLDNAGYNPFRLFTGRPFLFFPGRMVRGQTFLHIIFAGAKYLEMLPTPADFFYRFTMFRNAGNHSGSPDGKLRRAFCLEKP